MVFKGARMADLRKRGKRVGRVATFDDYQSKYDLAQVTEISEQWQTSQEREERTQGNAEFGVEWRKQWNKNLSRRTSRPEGK